ncbi:cyclin-dependent protein kinase [Rhizophlyctis rosea]|uniref:Cyclin-dependent protein kinase n=1 Tax=Rhizophlyctis rosea TaxID=64517 RepID=A0AAD5X5M4_9FUNG|nr:cyclin-dependent protein kinase [Rhizophlyctis rosea]
MDGKKSIPFQKDQIIKIFDVLGQPNKERWPGVEDFPEYSNIASMRMNPHSNLKNVFLGNASVTSEPAFQLLAAMLEYDPDKRITADAALRHTYFAEDPVPSLNSFVSPSTKVKSFQYPTRKLQQEENNEKNKGTGSQVRMSRLEVGYGAEYKLKCTI